jgi:hypothetical protein
MAHEAVDPLNRRKHHLTPRRLNRSVHHPKGLHLFDRSVIEEFTRMNEEPIMGNP